MNQIHRYLLFGILAALLGALGCGSKPTPELAVAEQLRTKAQETNKDPVSAPSVYADEEEKPGGTSTGDEVRTIPADAAVVEFQLQAEVKITIDGQDIGKKRQHVFGTLEPRRWYKHEILMKFPDGKEAQRNVLVRAGRRIRLDPFVLETAEKQPALGAGQTISSVAISADGKRFLVGSHDESAVLWDLTTGRILHTFQGHCNKVLSVALSPRGDLAATGSQDKTAVLWDALTGQRIRVLKGHHDEVHAVAFSQDGRHVLTGSWDKMAILWDVNTGRQVRIFQGMDDSRVEGAAISPNGKLVATGHWGGDAVLWDAMTGQKRFQLAGHKNVVPAVAFSQDGKLLLSGDVNNSLFVWNTATGERVRDFKSHNSIWSASFSPDGSLIVAGSGDSYADVWDSSGPLLCHLKGRHEYDLQRLVFSPDGERILAGAHSGTASILDLATGNELCHFSSFNFGKDWLVRTKDDFVDASREGRKIKSIQNLAPNRFYPGLLATVWRGESPMTTQAAAIETKDAEPIIPERPLPDPTSKSSKQSKDQAIVEFQLPPGATATLDGREVNPRQRQTITLSTSGNIATREVMVRFDKDRSVRRQLLLQPGQLVQVTELPPSSVRPELVLQTGHLFGVDSAAFSPDGKHVLTMSGNDGTILWDVASGAKLRSFEGYGALAFHPKGGTAIAGKELWDVVGGRKIRSFEGHSGAVTAVAFSPDGRRLLTGSADKTAILWDAATAKPLNTLAGHGKELSSVAFAPDGHRVLTGGGDDNSAILWDADSGQSLQTFRHDAGFGTVNSVGFTPDGKHVVTASESSAAVLWEIGSGKRVRKFECGTLWSRMAISPDGRILATTFNTEKKTVLWDISSGKALRTLSGHTDLVNYVVFSPDSQSVLTCSSDHTAILWQVSTGQVLHRLKGEDWQVHAIAVSQDGQSVLTGANANVVNLWDVGRGNLAHTFTVFTNSESPVAFDPTGRRVLTGSFYGPVLWDFATRKKLSNLRVQEGLTSVAFSPDGKRLATGAWDKSVILWELAEGASQAHSSRFLGQHDQWVLDVAFSADGKQVLSGSLDKTAVLWDAAGSGGKLHTFNAHSEGVTAVAFSPDGRLILTASEDKTAILWDAVRREKLRTLTGHEKAVRCAYFSPDGGSVLTVSGDRTAKLWNAAEGRLLRTFQAKSELVSAAFSADGQRVLLGTWDNAVILWDLATGDELCKIMSIDYGNDWAVVTPEGLFDGSKDGLEKVFYRVGKELDLVPLDRFFQDYHSPGLLAALWSGKRPMPAKSFAPSPAPALKALVNQQAPSPSPSERGEGAKDGQIALDVTVTDRGGGFLGPWLQHNGAALASGRMVKKDGKTTHFRFLVPLVSGDNRMEVRAASGDGSWEAEPVAVNVPFDGKLPEPELYVVAIGINRFAPGAGVTDLSQCVADATSIADLFRKRAGKLYRQVHVTQLLDDQATKAGILKAVADLSTKARPQDTLVLFIASHGHVTQYGSGAGQRLYLFPHDFRKVDDKSVETPPDKSAAKAEMLVGLRGFRDTSARESALRRHALAIDELGEVLAGVPALKRVLIFDTCHSGSAVSLADKEQNIFAFRGAMTRFGKAQGVYSLSAVKADELAAETGDLGHAILTYALLAGAGAAEKGPLAGKKAESGDVLDWFRFARENVPTLYEKYVGRSQQVELSGEDQPGFPLLRADVK